MVPKKMHSPQEVEVHFILPALRRAMTKAFKARGKSQKEIAQLLNVTEPAVSQYVSAKRAKHVEFNRKVKKAVSEMAEEAVDRYDVMGKTQSLLKVVRDEGITCTVCRSVTGAPANCNICFG
ncbi:MAG: transcriptional regulator [Candidatus Nanoarchaeia archaeon]